MIPGLLKEPNGSDPLNNEAATLQLRDKKLYEEKIKEYIDKYATKEKYQQMFGGDNDSDDSDSGGDLQEEDSDSDEDMDGTGVSSGDDSVDELSEDLSDIDVSDDDDYDEVANQ